MPPGTICTPNHFNTSQSMTYLCLSCKSSVDCESIISVDLSTKEFTVYSPASRYYCLEGVFCGPTCALKKLQES